MRLMIRSKLMIAITLLIAVLFSLVAFLFINEKKVEIADDIYLNALAFSRLTADDVVDDYELYLAENSFVYFNREIGELFDKNADISKIAMVSYGGDLLYDSDLDTSGRFEGASRLVTEDVLEMVQAEHLSVRTVDGRTFYLNGDRFVDLDENVLPDLESGALVEFFVVPTTERYAVIYGVDYASLFERVAEMRERIIYMALFGVMLGILLSFFMSRQVTRPVSRLVEGAQAVAAGDFKARVDVRTNDELAYLAENFNKMTADLEESMEAKLYKDRVAHELQLATEIQKQLIPDDTEIPQIDGLDIAAGLVPAEEIGGDLYDFMKLDENKLRLYLGDVTGHGVPAGIVSSIANALFHGYRQLPSLKDILVQVNDVLKVKTMPNMFITLCMLEWDAMQKQLHYVSAGHEQLVHFRAAEAAVELMPAGGVALGMFPKIDSSFEIVNIDFQIGDFVVVYSDGVPEAWRNEKENYGMERLQKFCASLDNKKSAKEIKDAILADVEQFRAGYKQQDDITLIVLKRV